MCQFVNVSISQCANSLMCRLVNETMDTVCKNRLMKRQDVKGFFKKFLIFEYNFTDMPKKSNPSHDNKDINKVEETSTGYSVEKNAVEEEELHPVLIQLLEKSIQEANEGKLIPHEEAMRRIKEKFPFLK